MTDTSRFGWVRFLGGFAITVIVAVLVGAKIVGEAATLEQGRVYDVCFGVFGCNGIQSHEVMLVVSLLLLALVIGFLMKLVDPPLARGGESS
jgi:hypothetical protein